MTLPQTARDVFRLTASNRLLYQSVIAFYRATGGWQYPQPASGDLETMRTIDKIYWLYKTTNPIRRAEPESGLEVFFAAQSSAILRLPENFHVQASLTLSAVGDLMPHPFLRQSGETLYGRIRDEIFGAAISMANLECVIYPEASGTLDFSPDNGPPLFYRQTEFDVAKGPSGARYAFMATACNHSLDFGAPGVASTMAMLEQEGIAFHGINRHDEESAQATVLERNGIRVGIVSHTFGLNAYQPPPERPGIVNRSDLHDPAYSVADSLFATQIAWCRRHDVDFVVAHLHWGYEHEFYPRQQQVQLAHALAEAGIDLIIGHHPHVLQPMEYYRCQRDPLRVVPIYYSLGNLINPFSAEYLRTSGLAQIEITKGFDQGESGRTYVTQAGVKKVVQVVDEVAGVLSLRI